jgi:hypothetical protein
MKRLFGILAIKNQFVKRLLHTIQGHPTRRARNRYQPKRCLVHAHVWGLHPANDFNHGGPVCGRVTTV